MNDSTMFDRQAASSLIRLTPKKAPFRRGEVHFTTLSPEIFYLSELSPDQLLQLTQEPLVDVDESIDGGIHWRRYSLPRPDAGDFEHPTDPAHSPERAVDPTGPIVARAPVATADGPAAPAEAADPAVPIAAPAPANGAPGDLSAEAAAAAVLNGEQDRPVATADPVTPAIRKPRAPAA